ncbi:polysaccharide biosynthesis tyrosine autokinase [Termitidicoccus mucosus]|uniref:CobQ/CobB/MinD/ParA nucleotide binding domain-containing protein n=1 Tax=Termitidicoccus mucosus TaxID=1184151 RepID=A0A178IFJ2_9BACT|nr:hypothetical protein AW736_20190 [Opitutaceae bacterium TSB47]
MAETFSKKPVPAAGAWPPQSSSPFGEPPPFAGGSLPRLDIRQILLCIRERWIVAVSLAILVCVLLGVWLLNQPKVFQASATLLVDRAEKVLGNEMTKVVDDSVGGSKNDPSFDTHLAQITSREMVQRVVASFTPEEKTRVLAAWLDKDDPPLSASQMDGRLSGLITSGVGVQRQGTTFLIRITCKHREPAMAALVATRFAECYIVYLMDRNASANDSAISFLRAQTEDLRKKAEASERALHAYREKSRMVSLEESQNIVVDRMKAISSALTEAQVALLAIEARLQQAESVIAKNSSPLELASITEFSSLASVQSQLDELVARKAVMAEKYGRRHPAMIDQERSIQALEKLRGDLILTAVANLRNQREKALENERQLQRQLADSEKASLALDRQAVEYNVLRREAETNRATYTQVLSRLNEASLTAQLGNSNIKIAERARPPTVPLEPNPKKILLSIGFLGVLIVIGYPVGMELLFNRIKTWTDVERYIGLPLLSEFPVLKNLPGDTLNHLVLQDRDPDAGEVVRGLYAQLKLSSRLDAPKTLLVTSTIPGEGKSFVASNLATAFAAHGLRTLIIDGDLRRPVQHRLADAPNTHGLLRWLDKGGKSGGPLANDPDLDLLRPAPNLFVLRAGGTSRRISELLDNEKLKGLFEQARREFDILVIDTPPAGIFPDAFDLVPFASELVYVVRFNHVSRPQVHRVTERFRSTGLEMPGIVLNMMPSGRGSAAYYSGYGYYGSKHYSSYYKEGQLAARSG